eukprot:TRINITY_DN70824_c0_g1_i1.p1 TRINITY_DN70824_c0_g1~~TRINITY_DN70824_c0_g1_i1.p1  ORF type:complete len:856 (+),score=139.87 TRINITY_DN70824_c0_g1_i1:91-2658(+)
MPPLSGKVVSHGGLERRDMLDAVAAGHVVSAHDGLFLRVQFQPTDGTDEPYEVLFLGYWAALHVLGLGDHLTITGAQTLNEADSQCGGFEVRSDNDNASVEVYRPNGLAEGSRATLRLADLAAGRIPDWLRLPPTRPVCRDPMVYRYVNFLCQLRDAVEANVFAVVWENAKPGPSVFHGRPCSNIIIVDRSFDTLPCSTWLSTDLLSHFSVQLSLHGHNDDAVPGVDALPYLMVGDIVRLHRIRVSAKPPRYLNLRMQRFSSLCTFTWEDENLAVDAAPQFTPISSGNPTRSVEDFQRAAELRFWIHHRLSTGTISNYLVWAADIELHDSHRDVIVKVLTVHQRHKELIVTDGSTDRPLRVEVSDTPSVTDWLLKKVKVGHWLKLRAVRYSGAGLSVNAATVTRVPAWCYDVQARLAKLESNADAESLEALHVAGREPTSPLRVRQAAPLEAASPAAAGLGGASSSSAAPAAAVPVPAAGPPAVAPGFATSSAAPAANAAEADAAAAAPAQPQMHEQAPAAPAAEQVPAQATATAAAAPQQRTLAKRARADEGGNDVADADAQVNPEEDLVPVALDFNDVPTAAVPEVEVEAAAPGPAAAPEEVEVVAPPAVPAMPAAAAAASDGLLLGPVSTWTPGRAARLRTVYSDDLMHPLSRLREVHENHPVSNTRSYVLGHFFVARVCHDVDGVVTTAARMQVEQLVHARCRVCSSSFRWSECPESFREDLRAAKRRRNALLCGHWLFTLEYRFRLLLRDEERPSDALMVHVVDSHNDFFGWVPQQIVTDDVARENAQKLLDDLVDARDPAELQVQPGLQARLGSRKRGHSLVICRTNELSSSGIWLVCDSQVRWTATDS